MRYENLVNKKIHVAFKIPGTQQGAQGLMMMAGTLIEAGQDYICLQVTDGGGIDRYISHDMIAFIDRTSDITRATSLPSISSIIS